MIKIKKYDFEKLINRKNTGSGKWNQMYEINPDVAEDIVPLSVADMEFKTAPEIVEGLKRFLDESVLGYTSATDDYYKSVIGWMERRHGFSPNKEWFIEMPGVVPALKHMVSALTRPGDSVLIMTPVYYPFRSVAETQGRNIIETELIAEGNTYKIDFEDFEAKARREDVKLFILCSPHNPIGRVWTKQELELLCHLCYENDVFVISDEIHFDLIMPGYKHVSLGTFEEKYLENCAICTAPSKTFNLAGLQTANIFISNKDIRERVSKEKGFGTLNAVGYKACELAYNCCEDWLEQAIEVIDGNRKYIEEFMARNIPRVKVFEMQATYLMWLDFNALGMDYKELEKFMQYKAQLFLDEGYIFGKGGYGFERINIACPKWVIEGAMERLLKAVNSLGLG
ncbi:MAG: MalY/PatB family protein [Eubacteriales bacterium]